MLKVLRKGTIPSSLRALKPTPVSIETMTKGKFSLSLFRRRPIDEEEYFYAMHPRIPQSLRANTTGVIDDDDGDVKSIESFSTTATIDNNPGTGRVLDMYFFQPAGRQIERLAMRFTIRHLHPWRIQTFVNRIFEIDPWITPKLTLDNALQEIGRAGNDSGSTVVAGLKSLVQQAQ